MRTYQVWIWRSTGRRYIGTIHGTPQQAAELGRKYIATGCVAYRIRPV